MSDDVPAATMAGELTLSGVSVRVYVLDDGRRILDAEDVHAVFAAWADGVPVDEVEAKAFARALRGLQ